jgi:hypothetical protein
MADDHPHPTAQIALRLAGLALIASLALQGAMLRTLVQHSAAVTPGQLLCAAACFCSASFGSALLLLGPGLWTPVTIARRWQEDG